MAVIKCKMCGGSLSVTEGSSVCECEYCGTKQTVPRADDEKKLILFSRAGRLLRSCEFDKAAGVFESTVADFPEEAEAYWGLILCKYGIEYVDDPATGKKIPTCHRSGFESVEDDPNFEQACENADAVARRIYREEARQIEQLRKRILEVSGGEEPYDVFISYKETDEEGERTPDSVIAQDIYKALTNEGYRVFFSRISLEGKLGVEYEPYIFAALNSAKVLLAVGTDYENFDAVWVKNEWSRFLKLIAAGRPKTLIPVYKDMDPCDMPKELRGLAAQNMGKIGAMQDLLHGVEKLVGKTKPEANPGLIQQSGGPNAQALLKRGALALEDEDWGKAKDFFDQVLNMDAECAEAYLGLAMAENRCRSREALQSACRKDGASPLDSRALARARQFGDEKLRAWLNELEGERKRTEEARAEIEKKKMLAKLAAVIAAAEKERRKREELVRASSLAATRIAAGCGEVYVLNPKGEVLKPSDLFADQVPSLPGWKNASAISAGIGFVLGLFPDGSTRYTDPQGSQFFLSRSEKEMASSGQWRDIIAIAAGAMSAIGLKKDGSVVSASRSSMEGSVSGWRNITAVAAGEAFYLGLRKDGSIEHTVPAKLRQSFDFRGFTDLVAIAAGGFHVLGLKADGTVVATGYQEDGQLAVSAWKDVVGIAAGPKCSVGLKADGTVVTAGKCGNVSAWRNIAAVTVDRFTGEKDDCVLGITRDGRVLTGRNGRKGILRPDFHTWRAFKSLDSLEKELDAARKEQLAALNAEKAQLEAKLPTIKGLFAGSERRQIEERLAAIAADCRRLG